jgi:hypothetical protein
MIYQKFQLFKEEFVMERYIPEEFTEASAKELDKICDQTVTACLSENCLDLHDKTVVYTTVVRFLERCAQYIGEHPDAKIDISSLIKISAENRADKKGEKAGNIVPMIEVGEKFKLAIKDDASTEEAEAEE